MKISVLVVDDHIIFREGVKALLARESDIEVIGEASSGVEAVRCAEALRPNVIIMDILMPGMNGIEASRLIKRIDDTIKILILSVEVDRHHIIDAIDAGVSGYIPKDSTFSELSEAIRTVFTGDTYFNPKISQVIIRDYLMKAPSCLPLNHDLLTPREREMLQLIADGKNAKEIAYAFDISIKTVEVHRHNIMMKLDLYSVAELTKFAIREGLTTF